MRGPYHEFLLLPEGEAGRHIYTNFWDTGLSGTPSPPTYRGFVLSNHGIRVPDDLLEHMLDTLAWVPTEHPFEELGLWKMPWQGHGLDYSRHTAIRKRGAPVFRSICEAWAALFSQAPRSFELRGGWLPDEGQYERLEFHREEIVPLLQKLVRHAERASTGEFFVLHVGI
jgi:hypothetical protein